MSTFPVTTHFNLGTDLGSGFSSGTTALQYHYGAERNKLFRAKQAMRACRRDWGKYGTRGAYYTNRNGIGESIGKDLLEGVQHLLRRFGDTDANRAELNKLFRALEEEWNSKGNNLGATDEYDEEDDNQAGGSFGKLVHPGWNPE